jgi:predicted Zn-dependent peptidase
MFKKARLGNGMTVVMEQMKNLRSVSLGIWVKVGSRNEPADKNGISHFLEHMFFKGTKKRNSRQIAVDIDSLGGELNAFTSKEGTTFYIKVLYEYLEKGLELLSDVFLHPTFPENEIVREKGVVTEEIKMVEDTPDEHIHDLFSRLVWGDDGLGQTVLGRRGTVKSFKRDDLLAHIRKYYGTADTIVACAGKIDEGRLTEMLNRSLYKLRQGKEAVMGVPPVFRAKTSVCGKDLSESHICLGVQGIEQSSPDRYCMLLLNTILGGGLSSKLFQEIREKRGLAYSVYSFISSYKDTGLWAVYAGTGRKKVNEVVECAVKEMYSLHETITDEELQRAKDQLKGNLILGLESTSRRMQNIAVQQIYLGRQYSPREIMRAIDSVTISRAREVARRLMEGSGVALTVLGPVQKSEISVSLP